MRKAGKIIFIMTDSQRWDMVGCYGHPEMRTPNLDRLAAGGMRFERSYTCQPLCAPARAGLFIGTWPHSNGVWANDLALGDNVKSIGQRFQDAGLHTAYVGKWHLDGSDYYGLGKCAAGWDPRYWFDLRNYVEAMSPTDRQRSRKTSTNADPALTAEFTFAHQCSDRAIDFLQRHHQEDFFLVVSYDEPHGPCICPQPFAEMFRDYRFPTGPNVADDLHDKPEHQRIWAGKALEEDRAHFSVNAQAFLGCNSFVDHEIGRVLDAIDRFAPDALVIYTSDHGDAMGAHRLFLKGPAAYDELTRVPLLVRWPGQVPAGSLCAHPVSHIDLVPTLLDAAGLPVPASVDGQSMLATLRDPAHRPNEAIFMEFGRDQIGYDGYGGFQPMRAVFDGRFKLAINLLSSDELYDLHADPQEMTNLISSPVPEHAAVRDALHDRLLDWMNRTRDPFRGYYWERRPWRSSARPAAWPHTNTIRGSQREWQASQLDYATGMEMTQLTRSA